MATAQQKLAAVQTDIGGIAIDGIPGNETRNAFEELMHAAAMERKIALETAAGQVEPSPDAQHATGVVHEVKASTFADDADVAAFKRCKASGASDQFCFSKGDNGVGFTGLNCNDASVPYIALPPDDWAPRYGSASKAAGQPVLVTVNGITAQCKIGDTMPHKANITNGCGIDLAPGAQRVFGLKAPCTVSATWQWVS